MKYLNIKTGSYVICDLLTKSEIKMIGYWTSSFTFYKLNLVHFEKCPVGFD